MAPSRSAQLRTDRILRPLRGSRWSHFRGEDPPNGRLPALTTEGQKKAANRTPKYDNVEERPLAERCILGFNSGPPMMPSAYNNNMQLVQTPTRVVILNEMVHSARVIDLSGRAHRPSSMRFLTGDSIGHWEGNTLVVRTTNFNGGTGAQANGSVPKAKMSTMFLCLMRFTERASVTKRLTISGSAE